MIATLTFTLPEDTSEYHMYTQASGMFLTLCEIDQRMRDILKYSDSPESQLALVQELREFLHTTLNDHHVTLEI